MAGDQDPQWGRNVTTGFEMAVGVALGYLVGHWLGNKYGWEPWGSVVGAMIGMVAGAYLLIKEVNRDNNKK